jgi:hypothetical protein
MSDEKQLKHRLVNLLSQETEKKKLDFDLAVFDERIRSIFEPRIGINYT